MMAIFATILGGVTVFVLGQILLKWAIEPIHELRKVIAEVLFRLATDHATIHNADIVDKQEALSTGRKLEELGARLLSSQCLIPFYDKVNRVVRLPSRDDILFSAKRLSSISKSMFGNTTGKFERLDLYRKEICERLGLEDPISGGETREELVDAIKALRTNRGA
jgi:hypothetical protein